MKISSAGLIAALFLLPVFASAQMATAAAPGQTPPSPDRPANAMPTSDAGLPPRQEPKTPADFAFRDLVASRHSTNPDRWKAQVDLAFAFMHTFPDDKRVPIVLMGVTGRVRVPHDDDEFLAKQKAYFVEQRALALARPDIGAEWAPLFYSTIEDRMYQLDADPAKVTADDLAEVRAWLDRLEERVPQTDLVPGVELAYLALLNKIDHAAFLVQAGKLAAGPNPTVASLVKDMLKAEQVKEKPFEMSFTALDGRSVDVAKLRGKVVLIDFWATWCGPCIEELPKVKKIYEAYHDKGFEIIGVSLDTANSRKRLTDFVRDHALPWPQHFDGGGSKNKYAMEFAVKRIPAMFLIGPDGNMVDGDVKGAEALEKEVKRLLKL